MALNITEMRYQGIPETQCDEYEEGEISQEREEKVIRKLTYDVVSDFRKLTQGYKVHPVKMESMIPMPLEELVGKELKTEQSFLRWIANRKTDTSWGTYCVSRKDPEVSMNVNFYESWPLNNWCMGNQGEVRFRKLKRYLDK